MGTKKVDQVQIVRHGESLIVPETLPLDRAVQVLQRQMVYEEEEVRVNEAIDAWPWDGAIAMNKALQRKFGWATAEPTPGFFGPNPPNLIAVEVGPGQTTNIIWGRFSVPGVEGWIATDSEVKENRLVFKLVGVIKRKHEQQIKEIANDIRQIVREESIYRGKAIRIRFEQDNPLPPIRFIDTASVREEELVFPRSVMEQVEVNIWEPMISRQAAKAAGIPYKRGILLEGKYGVGKTLVAYITAKLAIDHGVTFIYNEDPKDLQQAIRLAKQYEPAVIFSEDIDRSVSGERTQSMDDILNTIDGIESKSAEVMVVLTTNHVENINKAMLRPGRLDAVISVTPPDAEAVQRLMRLYGRGLIAPTEDLSTVGEMMDGQIPAVIRETVERAKLASIRRARLENSNDRSVKAADLEIAAKQMNNQIRLMQPTPKDPRSDLEKLGHAIANGIEGGVKLAIRRGVDLGELVELTDTNHKQLTAKS